MRTELKNILQSLNETEHLELLNRVIQANEFRRILYKYGMDKQALAQKLDISLADAKRLTDGTHDYDQETMAKVTIIDREMTTELEKAKKNGAK